MSYQSKVSKMNPKYYNDPESLHSGIYKPKGEYNKLVRGKFENDKNKYTKNKS